MPPAMYEIVVDAAARPASVTLAGMMGVAEVNRYIADLGEAFGHAAYAQPIE